MRYIFLNFDDFTSGLRKRLQRFFPSSSPFRSLKYSEVLHLSLIAYGNKLCVAVTILQSHYNSELMSITVIILAI